jgi:phosphoribosylamine--glycine ligase
MNVLVVGSGGREHAIVWKLHQSPSVEKLYCAPGNGGIATQAELVPIRADDLEGLLRFARNKRIDLTVVGPEQPLVAGIVDLFEAERLTIFGPTKSAARLEGSKVFAKEFMRRHGIPTARYRSFAAGGRDEAARFIAELSPPMVVKADGLAAGKGVLICTSREEANGAVDTILQDRVFGEAGNQVVIEEYLEGEEVSLLALTDGTAYASLAPAQDHKRILDSDQGKNTGGMGAYAPAPVLSPAIQTLVEQEVVRPLLDGMRDEGMPYRGCLYVGLMMTKDGPRVLEFNCRFGDPEAQVVIPLIDGDFARILHSVALGRLEKEAVRLHPATAVCVVMASGGYPDHYETGKAIFGLDAVDPDQGEVVFHAGTRSEGGQLVTSGGRVLGVTAIGYATDLAGTIGAAYRIVHRIAFDGAYYRSDIGKKALRHM